MDNYIENNKELFRQHFDKIRQIYPSEEVVRFLAKYKHEYLNSNMLDWGCGTGRHTLLGCNLGYNVYAVDYVKNCVNITKERVESELPKDCVGKVEKYIVNQDIDIEEIPDQSMDVILAWELLYSNTKGNESKMIKNMYRMLKNGGRAFCNFRTERDSQFMDSSVAKETDENGTFVLQSETTSKAGLLCHIGSLDELTNMFVDAGFEMENVELYEFTQNNRKIKNSWWHVTLYKEKL